MVESGDAMSVVKPVKAGVYESRIVKVAAPGNDDDISPWGLLVKSKHIQLHVPFLNLHHAA
jgi:hypothetical protein